MLHVYRDLPDRLAKHGFELWSTEMMGGTPQKLTTVETEDGIFEIRQNGKLAHVAGTIHCANAFAVALDLSPAIATLRALRGTIYVDVNQTIFSALQDADTYLQRLDQ